MAHNLHVFACARRFNAELAPLDEDKSWVVEVWARANGSPDTQRVVLMSGRYRLEASRDNVWSFEVLLTLTRAAHTRCSQALLTRAAHTRCSHALLTRAAHTRIIMHQ